jgi:RHS repeat-associated protein
MSSTGISSFWPRCETTDARGRRLQVPALAAIRWAVALVVAFALSLATLGSAQAQAHGTCPGCNAPEHPYCWCEDDDGWGENGSFETEDDDVKPVWVESPGAKTGRKAVEKLRFTPRGIDFEPASAEPNKDKVKEAANDAMETVFAQPDEGEDEDTCGMVPPPVPCLDAKEAELEPIVAATSPAEAGAPVETGASADPAQPPVAGPEDANHDPVDPSSGELVLTEMDMVLPVAAEYGVPFTHVRTYRSRIAYRGVMGQSWDMNYDRRLAAYSDGCDAGVLYMTGGGRSIFFRESGRKKRAPSTETVISYVAPEGVPARLVGTVNGVGLHRWTLYEASGGGQVASFDFRGHIASLADPNGRGLRFEWEDPNEDAASFGLRAKTEWRLRAVTDSVGRRVDYIYDAAGRLHRVSEPTSGLSVSYEYDANDDLVKVTDATRQVDRYEYATGFATADEAPFPQARLVAACERACSSDGCGSDPGPCGQAMVDRWQSECRAACAACPALCERDCKADCGNACGATCAGECSAYCASDEMAEKVQVHCDDAWDKHGRKACEDCGAGCDQVCTGGCDWLFGCTVGYTSDGDKGRRVAECGGDWRALEGLWRTVTHGAWGILASLGEVLTCWLPWVGDGCGFDEAKSQFLQACGNDCKACCEFGDACSSDSCNEGRSCESDCRNSWFGRRVDGDTCTPAVGATGSCVSRAQSDCFAYCGSGCEADCRSETCEPGCAPACAEACGAIDGVCEARCANTDVAAACEVGCVNGCVTGRWKESDGGPAYGELAHLNHNLLKAYDGTGRLYLENRYGTDPAHPSFDAVVRQRNGDATIDFRYRDLFAEQLGTTFAPHPDGPVEPELLAPSDNPPRYFCPPIDGSEPKEYERPAVERVTVMTDSLGVRRSLFYDRGGRLIESADHGTGARRLYLYRDGRLAGVRLPRGGQRCFEFDAWGNETVRSSYAPPATAWHAWGERITARTDYSPTWPPRPLATYATDGAKVATYEWDAKGNLERAKDEHGRVVAEVVSRWPWGGARRVRGADGAVTEYIYDDATGTVVETVLDAGGDSAQSVITEADRAGRPLATTTPLGLTTMWHWKAGALDRVEVSGDGMTDVVDVEVVDGEVVETVHGALHTSIERDARGYPRVTVAAPTDGTTAQEVTCTRYGPKGQLLERIAPTGRQERYSYDGEGRLTQVQAGDLGLSIDRRCPRPIADDGVGGVVRWLSYDTDGQVTRAVDARGLATHVSYDGWGRLIETRSPTGAVNRRGYDARGRLAWLASYDGAAASLGSHRPPNPAGELGLMQAVEYTYNTEARATTTYVWHIDERGVRTGRSAVTERVDPAARSVTTVDDAGAETVRHFDGLGRLVAVDSPLGRSLTVEFTEGGRLVSQTSPAPTPSGELGERLYLDAWGRTTFVEYVAGDATVPGTSAEFDARGMLQSVTSATGARSDFVYDAFDRPTSTTSWFGDGSGEQVDYGWRPGGLLRTRTSFATPGVDDGAPAQTVYEYDALGRELSVKLPDRPPETLAYHGLSELVWKRTDVAAKREFEMAYDAHGALTGMTVHPIVPDRPNIVAWRGFKRDALGRVIEAVAGGFNDETRRSPTVKVTRSWTSRGMASETIDYGTNAPGPFSIAHAYDGRGLRASSWLQVPGDGRVYATAYRHDANGRLTGIAFGDADVSYHYPHPRGPADRRTAVSRLGGRGMWTVTNDYTFDALGQLRALSVRKGSRTIARWDWAIPSDGVPRAATLLRDGAAAVSAVYDVDRAGRVLVEADQARSSIYLDATDSWDTAFEVVRSQYPGGKFSDARRYELDGRHNWVSIDDGSAGDAMAPTLNVDDTYASFGGDTPTYTSDGRLSSIGDESYEYNLFGQLSRASASGVAKTFEYDAFGRLVIERDELSRNETRLGYDGDARAFLGSDRDALMVVGGAGLDEHLLWMSLTEDKKSFSGLFHQDRMGSVFLATDSAGNPLEWYDYTAYGEQTIRGPDGAGRGRSAIGNRLGFQGHLFDSQLDLVHMRARVYRPAWGRFLSPDPIGLAGGSNLFAFVGGAPLAYSDPFGLDRDVPWYELVWNGLSWAAGQAWDAAKWTGGAAFDTTAGVISGVLPLPFLPDGPAFGHDTLFYGAQLATSTAAQTIDYAVALVGGATAAVGTGLGTPCTVATAGLCAAPAAATTATGVAVMGAGLLAADAHRQRASEALHNFNQSLNGDGGATADRPRAVDGVLPDAPAAEGVAPQLGSKLEYFLGRATGNAHNIERSTQMLRQLERVGLPDTPATRQYLTEHLTGVLRDPSNIVRVQENGRIVRESLLMGPRGALKLETVWDDARLITANLFGGR